MWAWPTTQKYLCECGTSQDHAVISRYHISVIINAMCLWYWLTMVKLAATIFAITNVM